MHWLLRLFGDHSSVALRAQAPHGIMMVADRDASQWEPGRFQQFQWLER